MAEYAANLKALECSNSTKSPTLVRLWSKAKNWIPFAVMLFPSALGNEFAISHFNFRWKALTLD
jgi:hypothetical protein